MARSWRWLILLPVFLGVRAEPPRTPPRFGIWYWHTPFEIPETDRLRLCAMGIRDLYVRAGTFTSDGERASVMMPQRWKSTARDFRVVLTLNFDPGLVSHLGKIPVDSLADDVVAGLRTAEQKATAAGIPVRGFQLDVDCPTRILPRYTALLRRVRSRLDRPLSITALPTWLNSPEFESLMKAVDTVVPQFYENQTGRTLDAVAPVADPEGLARGLARMAQYRRRFRVGLATYGHALLYDQNGGLSAMYRGLGPEDALRHPSLHFQKEDAFPSGERRLILKAVAPDMNGRGQGFSIAYVVPTAEALRRQLSVFEANRPGNCDGAILYRYPEPGEAMALPLRTVEAVMAGQPTLVQANVQLSKQAVPWAAISPAPQKERLPSAVRLRFTATGNGPSTTQPRALMVLLRFDRPGIQSVAAGSFDEAIAGMIGADGQFTRCAPARANVVLLARNHLLPDQVLGSGVIETVPDGATRVYAEWAAKSPDGETRGRSSNLLLSTSK